MFLHVLYNVAVDREGDFVAPTEVRCITLQVGGSINLQCSLEAQGDHVPEWSKDGEIITSNFKYIINRSTPTELKIQNSG